jgi:TetR/AcrR family transcriptional regulator, transcriptional repressor for nem operon
VRNKEQTITHLLDQASILFNNQGYKHTSISDITTATQYTKGAIYRHFQNKESLEVAAFKHLMQKVYAIIGPAIRHEKNAQAKIYAFLGFFESYVTQPIISGGCPLLNVSVEADDLDPELKKHAQKALITLEQTLCTILENGIKHGQIKANTPIIVIAKVLIATIEGGIMTSKLTGNNADIQTIIKYIKTNIITPILLEKV